MSRAIALAVTLLASVTLAREPGALQVESGSIASNQVQMMGLMAALALVPFAIVMLTSFSKIVVVLSMVRSALGTQQAPPTMVLTGLAAVLSAHVMAPTMERMWTAGRAARPRLAWAASWWAGRVRSWRRCASSW